MAQPPLWATWGGQPPPFWPRGWPKPPPFGLGVAEIFLTLTLGGGRHTPRPNGDGSGTPKIALGWLSNPFGQNGGGMWPSATPKSLYI